LYQLVAQSIRRDAARESVWKIEADFVAKYPEEVTAEIQRAWISSVLL